METTNQIALANKIADAKNVCFNYVGWNHKSYPTSREAYQRFFEAVDISHLTQVIITADNVFITLLRGKIIDERNN